MADAFDEDGNPGDGRFIIGNLDAYENDREIGPATFQVVPDPDSPAGEVYAMLRFNLPKEGSVRINEIGMFVELDPGLAPVPDDFGPMIIDDNRQHGSPPLADRLQDL